MTAVTRNDANLPLRSRLSREVPHMRPSEQKVAALLLYDEARITDWNLEALAQLADVSPAAVVRMCQALGFSGFRPFRNEWLLDNVHSGLYGAERDHPLWATAMALQEMMTVLSSDTLARAGQALRNAGKILVHGQGGSGHVARLAASSLTSIGRLAVALGESERDSAHLPVDADTVAVIISHRGENARVTKFAQRCQEGGATVIAVTSRPDCPLAQAAAIPIITGSPVDEAGKQLAISPSRVVQVAAIQALLHASRI